MAVTVACANRARLNLEINLKIGLRFPFRVLFVPVMSRFSKRLTAACQRC